MTVEFFISVQRHKLVERSCFRKERPTVADAAPCFTGPMGPEDEGSCGDKGRRWERDASWIEFDSSSSSSGEAAASVGRRMQRRSSCCRAGLGHIFLAVKASERRPVRLELPVICGSQHGQTGFFRHTAADCQRSTKTKQSVHISTDKN